MRYVCDEMRHLICVPYSIDGLHEMANVLQIKKCWFHSGKYPHYDIPKRRIAEIQGKCDLITPKELLVIIKEYLYETN